MHMLCPSFKYNLVNKALFAVKEVFKSELKYISIWPTPLKEFQIDTTQ